MAITGDELQQFICLNVCRQQHKNEHIKVYKVFLTLKHQMKEVYKLYTKPSLDLVPEVLLI